MTNANTAEKTRFIRPRAAVNESKDGKLQVVIEMPGVTREGLEVKIENNELRITGHRQFQGGKYLLRERAPGNYLQTYTLDETVDPASVDAVLEKGVLVVTLDLKEQVKPRTIKVRGE